MADWHKVSAEGAISGMGTTEKGLSSKESARRLEKYGYNRIVSKKKFRPIKIFLNQFRSFLILILILAVIISALAGDLTDAILILIILVINALLGFVQEFRAEKAMEALKKLAVPEAKVLRDGKVRQVSSQELVPGDVVLLEAGDFVPADGRLIEITDLQTDESSLTGESTSVQKQQCILKEAAVADRKNMVFMGTVVTKGRASYAVTETGMKTEIGKIAGLLTDISSETPLQKRLAHFGRWLGLAVIAIASATFILGIIRGESLYNMALTSVTVAVSAVPEGLPVTVTVALALGTKVMAKRRAVVRRLSAVETLGSVTVICSDKTGTLTTNEMTVRKVLVDNKIIGVTGNGYEVNGNFVFKNRKMEIDGNLEGLFKIGTLCNDSHLVKEEGGAGKKDRNWSVDQLPAFVGFRNDSYLVKNNGNGNEYKVIGDPTEGALLVLSAKGGFWKENLEKEYRRIGELPFTSERKMMTTIHRAGGKVMAYSKGAPEKILSLCKMEIKEKNRVLKSVEEMGKDGLRVLAFAKKEVKGRLDLEKVESSLDFVGLAGMIDPPRKEVKDAIKICRQAGIRVVMITGDHKVTAEAVAKEIGLLSKNGKVLTGVDLDKISYGELKKIVKEVDVYARISPEHKLNIVSALKNNGEIVAVTGDGVNDAPALKKADIGIAMGIKGTDVAKDASDMVLADDNFATIVSAVEEGRGVFDNIRKFVAYILSVNFSEIFFITVTVLAGLPLPLLPVQILWINLLTDGVPSLTLTVDQRDKDIMRRKPRDPKETITSGRKPFIFAGGMLLLVASLAAFLITLSAGLEKARTVALTTIVAFELLYVFNCRSEKRSVFRNNPLSNKYLIAAVAITFLLHLSIIYISQLASLFNTVPLGLADWAIVASLSLAGLLVLPEIFAGKTRHRL